jgi:hypothetical protein
VKSALMEAAAESASKEGSTKAGPESRPHPKMTGSRSDSSADHSRAAETSAEPAAPPEPAGKSSPVLSKSTGYQKHNCDQNPHKCLLAAYPRRSNHAIRTH